MAGPGKAVHTKQKSILEPTDEKQLPKSTNCLTCTEDGRFLGLGHTLGLSVWCASSFTRVAKWLQPQLEITFIQMTRMAEMTYLLGTIDDMGVSRVFGLHSDVIHLLSVINTMQEDINVRSIFVTFDLHESGHYGAASVSCNGAVWLEIYQFPVEAWLREVEMVSAQQKDGNLSGGSDVKWSLVTLLMKISPPTVPTGKASDFLTHCMALDIIQSSSHQKEQSSFSSDAGKTKMTHGKPRSGTQHFLLPCDWSTGDSKARPAGLPVAVAVWWSGSHNLLQYLLQKASSTKPDVTSLPEMLWPNAKEILCSAVSRCTCYIALGLEDALVCIWDRRSGAPLSSVLLPEETSALSRIQFVDNWSASAQDCQIVAAKPVSVLVLYKNGAIYTVTAGQGMQSCTMLLTERPKDSRDLPTFTKTVPFLQDVWLVVQRSGKIILKDVLNSATVCHLTLPTSYQIASPYNPVYALNAKQQVLFIRGDRKTSCNDLLKKRSQSQLFVFQFDQSDIIKPHIVSHLDPPRQQTTLCHGSMEEICNLCLEQRMHSVDERNKALVQTWGKLQETAVRMRQTP
ncbi:WD repeat-containing protein 93 isoform X1 [Girardinichthys multiradiatus]|uniref:WD repeat-containing protein 93 isoform X1 n=2 Tax=Girardinichthys multiradiatus TaxID=208333 RepID=UPI001FAC6C12|nr:WD repeat-containing protein 93 isoform X1 [Girardinichthys multiradiatus]